MSQQSTQSTRANDFLGCLSLEERYAFLARPCKEQDLVIYGLEEAAHKKSKQLAWSSRASTVTTAAVPKAPACPSHPLVIVPPVVPALPVLPVLPVSVPFPAASQLIGSDVLFYSESLAAVLTCLLQAPSSYAKGLIQDCVDGHQPGEGITQSGIHAFLEAPVPVKDLPPPQEDPFKGKGLSKRPFNRPKTLKPSSCFG